MAVWATIDENPHWKIPFEIAVRHLGPPGPQPPHAPGPHVFGERDYLRGILEGAGFGAIAIEARPFHVRVDYDSGSGRARRSQFEYAATAARRKTSRRDSRPKGGRPRRRGGVQSLYVNERRRAPSGDIPARPGAAGRNSGGQLRSAIPSSYNPFISRSCRSASSASSLMNAESASRTASAIARSHSSAA